MSRLYKRKARVTVWEPKADTFFSDVSATNAIVITDLRVTFEIERTGSKHPDTCKATITNASEDTRAVFHRKPVLVRLEAGYDDDIRTLFTGDLLFSASKLDKTDWVTTFQIADGLRSFREGRVAQSFKEGATVLDALKAAAKALQFSIPSNILNDATMQSQFAAGLTLHGPAEKQLTNLLTPYGYNWSIQNNRLVILKQSDTQPGDAIVVDENTGLIGSPETGAPTKDQKIPVTTIKMLLNDRVLPGTKIQLTSRDHNKVLMKVVKLTMTGDTHGGDFQSTVEAKPL